LAAGVIVYSCFHIVWGLLAHADFATYGFDLGIHDQAAWLLSQWKSPFVTITGNPYFGDHLSWIMFLVVPLYWLFDSVKVLLVLQPLLLGLAAIPAFLVAREKLRSEWLATGIAWAYLLTPYVNWITVDRFHPDAFEVHHRGVDADQRGRSPDRAGSGTLGGLQVRLETGRSDHRVGGCVDIPELPRTPPRAERDRFACRLHVVSRQSHPLRRSRRVSAHPRRQALGGD
jgi:hypothetical protein